MTEPLAPTSLWLTLSGVASATFGFFFDVPGSTVFAAAAGAFLAVRLGPTVSFWQALRSIVAGTFVGALLTSLFIHWAGDYPQRGVALVLTFFLIYFRAEILELMRKMLKGEGFSLRALLEGLKK